MIRPWKKVKSKKKEPIPISILFHALVRVKKRKPGQHPHYFDFQGFGRNLRDDAEDGSASGGLHCQESVTGAAGLLCHEKLRPPFDAEKQKTP